MGFLSDLIMSSKENCIPGERSLGAFNLYYSKISYKYYYEDKEGLYQMNCNKRNDCILKDSTDAVVLKANLENTLNKKCFSVSYGTLDSIDDTIQINRPYNYTCKYSTSNCTLNNNEYIFWHVNHRLFRTIGSINSEIWTIIKKPLTQFISIRTGPDSYLLELREYLKFDKNCFKTIRKTNINNIFVQSIPNITKNTVEDLSKYNVSKSPYLFCESKKEDAMNLSNTIKSLESLLSETLNNWTTYFIIIFVIMIFLMLIIIISISAFWKALKTSSKNRDMHQHNKIISQKLNNVHGGEEGNNSFKESRKNEVGHLVQFNCNTEEIVENSFYGLSS